MSIEQEQEFDYRNISNAEIKAKWGLPDDIDPNEVEIEKINPGIFFTP